MTMSRFVKNISVAVSLLVIQLFFAAYVTAGTLSCAIRTSTCNGGEVEVFEMQDTSNAHAGMPAASYNNLVCCSGVFGLSNSCSGIYATALKLSAATNAHVRQGTLADYAGANNACLSVPTGSAVTVGYQATDCTGYDTTIGSMTDTTNSHVGNGAWGAGTTKICATASGPGSLSADIVDAGGTPVASPSIAMSSIALSLSHQTVTGTFGIAAQKIRVDNSGGNPQWNLSLAALSGATAYWDGATSDYDYNDPTALAGDGADADTLGGQMSIDPSVAAITPKAGCDNTGLSLGSSSSYSQGATDSVTLLVAGGSAGINCYWDMTGVGVMQSIPDEQQVGAYAISMMLTVTAI